MQINIKNAAKLIIKFKGNDLFMAALDLLQNLLIAL